MMKKTYPALAFLLALNMTSPIGHAEEFTDGQGALEVGESPAAGSKVGKNYAPKTGKEAASKYMAPSRGEKEAQGSVSAPTSRFMAISGGFFANDQSIKVGQPESQNNVGRWLAGVSYRVGEWVRSMDLLAKFEVTKYEFAEGAVTKLSLMPVVTFPDASSRFPIYFGAGAGLGIFASQLASESTLSIDYTLFGGARFFDIWQNTGLFLESGLRNHAHLLSDGQYNGIFIASGFLFSF